MQELLTVGTTAKLTADINARDVVVYGYVKGNVRATGRIEIKKDGSVIGNLTTAQIMIEDGADFKGTIEIDRSAAKEPGKNVSPSQGDARPLVSVNRWVSKAHPFRPNSNCRLSTVSAHMVNDAAQTDCVATPTIYPVGRAGQLATASRKLRRQASRVLALYPMIYQNI
jgi:nicotinate-nucleotide pyrophosphorylase